jgi:hypothetical protein
MTLHRDGHVASSLNGCWRDKVCCSLIYTCQYIYLLAINTPGLWTHVDTEWNDEWLDLCVTRSGLLPLNVGAWVYRKDHHISDRYRELIARSSDAAVFLPSQTNILRRNVRKYMTKPLARPMPFLRRLIFSGPYRSFYKFKPQCLSGESWSQLTSLMLGSVTIETSTPELPVLRVLALRHVVISLSVIRKLLSVTPALEHLQISELGCPEFTSQDRGNVIRLPYGLVHLPQLETVEMSYKGAALLSLLHFIPLPQHRLGLNEPITYRNADVDVITALASTLREFWRASANGGDHFPPATLHICSHFFPWSHDASLSNRLHLGKDISWPWDETINRVFTRPSAFLGINVHELEGLPPDLIDNHRVDSIRILAQGRNIGLKLGTPLLDELIMRVEHLTIGDVYTLYDGKVIEQWPKNARRDLEDFVARIRQRSVSLISLTFVLCHSAMRALGDELRDSGMVEKIIWLESHTELKEMYVVHDRDSMMRSS